MRIRSRFTLAILLGGAALLVLFSTIVFLEARRRTLLEAEGTLRDHLEHAIDDRWEGHRHGPTGTSEHGEVLLVRITENGVIVPGAPLELPALSEKDRLSLQVTRTVGDRTIVAEGMIDLRPARAYLTVLARILALLCLGAIAILAPIAWIAAGRALAPFSRLADATTKLDAESLSRRFPVPGPDDEYRKLIEAFNKLLERLDGSFERLRLFAAQASHELRTPAAAILATAERQLRAGSAGPADLEKIVESADRLGRLTQQLLTLAQARHLADQSSVSEAELADFLEGVASDFGSRVEIVPPAEPVEIRTALGLVEIAVTNLLQNAVRYGGKRIVLSGGATGGSAWVRVEDDGSGMTDDEIASAAQPFVRHRPAPDTRGAGLGLAIVRSAAETLGGSLELSSSDLGGLRTEFRFARQFEIKTSL